MNIVTFSFPLGFPGEFDVGRMHHCSKFIESEISFSAAPEKDYLGLYFNLKGNLYYSVDGLAPGVIPKRHYNLVYVPKDSGRVTLKRGNYSSFCIEFATVYLLMVSERFPILNDLLLKVDQGIPAALSDVHLDITPEMFDSIQEIVNTTYSGLLREDFLRSKFVDLLITCLEHQRQLFHRLNKHDLEKVRRVHEYMLGNIQYAMTVSLLADQHNISKRKLERGFRLIYGTTVYDLLTSERMKKSLVLLRDTNMSLTEVARAVGYKRLNNFFDIFKKKVGYPPGTFRKHPEDKK